MTTPIGTYAFLPWLRRGIALSVTAQDGAAGPGARVTVPVDLRITGSGVGAGVSADVHRDIELVGPGDVVSVDRRGVVRMEPRPGIADFEPNYLPFVEFYEADLP